MDHPAEDNPLADFGAHALDEERVTPLEIEQKLIMAVAQTTKMFKGRLEAKIDPRTQGFAPLNADAYLLTQAAVWAAAWSRILVVANRLGLAADTWQKDATIGYAMRQYVVAIYKMEKYLPVKQLNAEVAGLLAPYLIDDAALEKLATPEELARWQSEPQLAIHALHTVVYLDMLDLFGAAAPAPSSPSPQPLVEQVYDRFVPALHYVGLRSNWSLPATWQPTVPYWELKPLFIRATEPLNVVLYGQSLKDAVDHQSPTHPSQDMRFLENRPLYKAITRVMLRAIRPSTFVIKNQMAASLFWILF